MAKLTLHSSFPLDLVRDLVMSRCILLLSIKVKVSIVSQWRYIWQADLSLVAKIALDPRLLHLHCLLKLRL